MPAAASINLPKSLVTPGFFLRSIYISFAMFSFIASSIASPDQPLARYARRIEQLQTRMDGALEPKQRAAIERQLQHVQRLVERRQRILERRQHRQSQHIPKGRP